MKNILTITLFFIALSSFAQTETTNKLSDEYASRTFFLYNNTLRMVNQGGDKDFDELIKDIEKMKVVWVNKKEKNFGADQYKKLVAGYKSEKFEDIMNTRHEGKSFNAYIKEKDGDTKGVVVMVDDGENVYVMDIVGKVALSKITSLFSSLDKDSEIGGKIKALINKQGQ